MNTNVFGLILVIAAIVLFFLIIVCVVLVLRWQRKTKWPFKEADKLLRGPGEELKRKIALLDERLLFETMGGICGGLVCLGFFGATLREWVGVNPRYGLGLGLLGILGSYAVSGWRIGRIWQERQNHFLGWFGERYVAEWLEPAKLLGWRIFHDVPFVNGGVKFNIDHVVVGVGGVLVIETKAKRKGNARPGRKDNVVIFNGHMLDWPWGTDIYDLEQSERNALWMTDWIHAEIGEEVHVSPLLVLPGWWLENKPSKGARPCRVVNPKWLPEILAKERAALTQRQVDLIALRLDICCRDVEE